MLNLLFSVVLSFLCLGPTLFLTKMALNDERGNGMGRRMMGIATLVIGLVTLGAIKSVAETGADPKNNASDWLMILMYGWILTSALVKLTMIAHLRWPTLNFLAICMALGLVVLGLVTLDLGGAGTPPLLVRMLLVVFSVSWFQVDMEDMRASWKHWNAQMQPKRKNDHNWFEEEVLQ